MNEARGPIMVVAGTRPEAIKLAPVIEWLDRLKVDYVFVWSGQHYDYEMSRVFFEQLGLPEPDEDLDVKSGTHAEQTARIMVKLEKAIDKYRPSIVVAEGDTNTVVATALTAAKKLVPFAHVEAGLRSWDRTMPEEINRIIADAVAELHFAPTELAAINLMHEGIPYRKIYVTGNTIVDVVLKYMDASKSEGRKILQQLGIQPKEYLLVTTHRQENTEDRKRLRSIVMALIGLAEYYPIIFPIHPRTVNKLKQYNLYRELTSDKNIILLKPLGYLQFLGLLAQARVVLTDSGSVQEEACTLKIPAVTLRYNTERPETVLIGANTLAGVEPEEIIKKTLEKANKYTEIRRRLDKTPNPLGDGKAGFKIAKILKNLSSTIRIEGFDARKDPYVTYAVVDKTPNVDGEYVISYYSWSATLNKDRASKVLIRAPLSYIRRILKELRIDTDIAYTQ